MAIVELDKVPSQRPRRGDRALIAGLGVAIGAFTFAMWLSAPHPIAQPTVAARPTAAQTALPQVVTVTTVSMSGVLVTPTNPTLFVPGGLIRGPLSLPTGVDNVDLFQIPDRLTNENLFWTLRSVVEIRGNAGLASVEGPAMITWTENGLQYWMVSPTRTTADLITIADGLKDEVRMFPIGRKVNQR